MKRHLATIFGLFVACSTNSCGADPAKPTHSLTATSEALVVIGSNDIFGEIRDAAGNVPSDPSKVIYARNAFDPPLGLLTPIKAPDDHHLLLSEWTKATGSIAISCNLTSSVVDISLEGLIPNGTYTFWVNFINKEKLPGQSVDFANDIIKIEPLGSGTLNIKEADGNGVISTSIAHSSCILSEATTIVLVVDYHINGKTFGVNHIPDEEDVNHLVLYY